jgi:hypothetical protein
MKFSDNDKQERVSRIAKRTPHEIEPAWQSFIEQEERATYEAHNNASYECKVLNDYKSDINNNTNITFPILINNKRAVSLLDCGAYFSSVDTKYCNLNKSQSLFKRIY